VEESKGLKRAFRGGETPSGRMGGQPLPLGGSRKLIREAEAGWKQGACKSMIGA